MKTFSKVLTFIFILFISEKSWAQSDCNPFYLLEEGKKWTTENYNARDKYRGKQQYEVKSLKEEGEKLVASIMLISYDKKDKLIMEKEVEFICENGILEIDMSRYMPDETMESFKEMDVDIEFDALTIPENLEVGEFLDDGGIDMTINGPMKMEMSVSIYDRKVMKKEDIEVPAGTYQAYKINSAMKFKSMLTTVETKNIEWVSKDVGVVRSEQYDKKGNLKSYTVLTEIN